MNWSEFFAMGGYALYVWGSYSVVVVVMVAEVLLLMRRRQTLLRRLGRMARLNMSVDNEAQT